MLLLKVNVLNLLLLLLLLWTIQMVVMTAYYQPSLLCQLHPFLEKKDLANATHAPVAFSHDYYITLYVELLLKNGIET